MAITKVGITDNSMLAVRDALMASGFFEGCTVEVDIDWSDITTVTTDSGPADEHTIFVDPDCLLYRYVNADWVPTDTVVTYGSAVSTTSHPTTLKIKDADGNLIFKMMNDPYANNASRGKVKWESFYANGSVQSQIGIMSGGYVSDYSCLVDSVWSCTNGIIIFIRANSASSDAYWMPIRIVKTNNGKYAFISCRYNGDSYPTTPQGYPSYSGAYCSDLDCITYADVDTPQTFLIASQYGLHYEVVPMLTNSGTSNISYTNKSGFLQYSTWDKTIKAITIDGKRYLTDSYFAISDE